MIFAAGGVLAFVALVAIETLLRRAARRTIEGTPIGVAPAGISLEAQTMPDLLWAGTTWKVTISNRSSGALHDCAAEVDEARCAIEGGLQAGGDFVLSWSHDTTNTDRCTRSGEKTIVTRLPHRVALVCRELEVDWSL